MDFKSLAFLLVIAPASAWGAPSWVHFGPDGGSVSALAVDAHDSSLVFAGAQQGGLFRSVDGGAHWSYASQTLAAADVTGITVDPNAPNTAFVCAGTVPDISPNRGCFRTRDGGVTWTKLDAGLGMTSMPRGLALDPRPPGTVYMNTSFGLYKSADQGDHFQPTGTTLPHDALVGSPLVDANDGTLYILGQDGGSPVLWISTNHGASFVSAPIGDPASDLRTVLLDPTSPGVLYGFNWDHMFTTSDRGGHWTQLAALPSGTRYVDTLAVHPSAPGVLFAGTNMGAARSDDGGRTWTASTGIPKDEDIDSFAFDGRAADVIYAGGSSTGIYKSTDGGRTFAPATAGFAAMGFAGVTIRKSNPAVIYAGSDANRAGGGLYASKDGGQSWNRILVARTTDVLAIDPFDEDHLLSTSEARVYESRNGGANWLRVYAPGLNVYTTAFDPVSRRISYAAGDAGVSRSTDDGVTFHPVGDPVAGYTLAIDPSDPNNIYVGLLDAGLLISHDAGKSWTPAGGSLPRLWVMSIAIDPIAPRTIYAAVNTSGLYKTSDGGQTWKALKFKTENADVHLVAVSATEPGVVYAAGVGVFVSSDGGDTFDPMNDGLRSVDIWGLMPDPVSPGVVYVATRGAGLARLDLRETTDAGASPSDGAGPAGLDLGSMPISSRGCQCAIGSNGPRGSASSGPRPDATRGLLFLILLVALVGLVRRSLRAS